MCNVIRITSNSIQFEVPPLKGASTRGCDSGVGPSNDAETVKTTELNPLNQFMASRGVACRLRCLVGRRRAGRCTQCACSPGWEQAGRCGPWHGTDFRCALSELDSVDACQVNKARCMQSPPKPGHCSPPRATDGDALPTAARLRATPMRARS